MTDDEVSALVLGELPDMMRLSRVVSSGVTRLQQLNREHPQSDLAGLHRIVDLHLAPLVLANPDDAASRYITMMAVNRDGTRPPLAMKLAALFVLDPEKPGGAT